MRIWRALKAAFRRPPVSVERAFLPSQANWPAGVFSAWLTAGIFLWAGVSALRGGETWIAVGYSVVAIGGVTASVAMARRWLRERRDYGQDHPLVIARRWGSRALKFFVDIETWRARGIIVQRLALPSREWSVSRTDSATRRPPAIVFRYM